MRKGLITFVVLVVAAAAIAATVASGGPAVSAKKDKNTKISAKGKQSADALAESVYRQVSASTKTGVGAGPLCAIAVIPGPAGNFNIRFGVFNTTGGNTLDVLIVDSFFSLGGSSLLHESVFATAPPPGGTLAVEYPSGVSGKGAAVLSFTGFDSLESVAFNTDPDTYDNPVRGNGRRHGPHAPGGSLLQRAAVCRNPRLQRRLQRVDRNADADVAVGLPARLTTPGRHPRWRPGVPLTRWPPEL